MNKELLISACSYIDDHYLEKCEKTKKKVILPSVLASAVAVLALFTIFNKPKTPSPSFSILYPAELWEITYNQITSSNADTALKNGREYYMLYSEALTESSLNQYAPEINHDEQCNGAAIFGPVGLEWIDLSLTDSHLPEIQIRLLHKNVPNRCFTDGFKPSQLGGTNGVSVVATEEHFGMDMIDLSLDFWLNDEVYITINSLVNQEQESEVKSRIKDIIAYYVMERRNLSIKTLQAKEPYMVQRNEISFYDAQNDTVYGNLFLRAVPDGFQEESIIRYIHPERDSLSGLWTKGLDQLSWRVAPLREADESRLVSKSETEKYDLSLYPIPRAESVPESLREVVDNPIFDIRELTLDLVKKRSYRIQDAGDTNGERMHFSVRYGDAVVEVSSKGVSSEWIYEQLKELQETKKE